MNEELKEILPKIMETIALLSPKLYTSLDDKALMMLIQIAYVAAKNDNLEKENLIYGTALLVLDMLSAESVTNISSKKIKDVAITMGSGYGVSKWKTWYDALVNGDVDGVYALRYVGIG